MDQRPLDHGPTAAGTNEHGFGTTNILTIGGVVKMNNPDENEMLPKPCSWPGWNFPSTVGGPTAEYPSDIGLPSDGNSFYVYRTNLYNPLIPKNVKMCCIVTMYDEPYEPCVKF